MGPGMSGWLSRVNPSQSYRHWQRKQRSSQQTRTNERDAMRTWSGKSKRMFGPLGLPAGCGGTGAGAGGTYGAGGGGAGQKVETIEASHPAALKVFQFPWRHMSQVLPPVALALPQNCSMTVSHACALGGDGAFVGGASPLATRRSSVCRIQSAHIGVPVLGTASTVHAIAAA